MVYSIDSVHLDYARMSPTQFIQIFSSASSVQQGIIPERLNQIYIVPHRWKEEILSFLTMYHTSERSLISNFRGRATIVAQHVSEKGHSESILYLRLVLIDQR